MALEDIRKPYRHGTLDVGDLDPDPIRQFLAWLEDAVAGRHARAERRRPGHR